MALLTIEGFEVPVLPGTEIEEPEHGDYARAYSGKLRSDIRARHRHGRVLASYFSTDSDAPALLAILRSPGPVLCGGTMIGDDAYFHARSVRSAPITATTVQISCELHETDDTPSDLLFSFDGDAPGTYTYTRTGTARYGAYTGTLARAAANVLRRDWLWLDGTYVGGPDTAAALIEAARTNLVDTDDITAYTDVNTPVVTSGIDDPDGGLTAYRVADNDAGSVEYKVRNVGFTGNATKAVVFVVRQATMPASGNQQLILNDTTAGVQRLALNISAWSAGVPTVTASAGMLYGKRYVGNGYWAIYAVSTTVTATNTNRVEIVPALTSAQTGSIDVWRVNAYNEAWPGWAIQDASEARNAGTWSASYEAAPQALTVYVKFIEAGSIQSAGSRNVICVGSTADPRLIINERGSGVYGAYHGNGTSTVVSDLVAAPTFGDVVELRVTLSATGVIQIGQSINGDTETTGAASGSLALAAKWNVKSVYIGSEGGNAPGLNPMLAVRIVTGSRTMAEMRDWAGARLHPRIASGGAVRSLSASVAATVATVAAESP